MVEKNIGTLLREARKSAGMTQGSVAKALDISTDYVSRIEKGERTPSSRVMKDIDEFLKSSKSNLGNHRTAEHIDRYGTTDRPPSGFVLIPRYNVEASAGGGAVVSDEQVVDRLAFREEWVRHALGVKPQDLALVTTIGDSMEPTLHPGDVVMLDMSVTQIQNNALYALQVNDSLLVKRVQRMMDGRVIIRSDNDLYEPETISTDMADSIKVVGRIVWAGRKF